jgi:hypothetical protein
MNYRRTLTFKEDLTPWYIAFSTNRRLFFAVISIVANKKDLLANMKEGKDVETAKEFNFKFSSKKAKSAKKAKKSAKKSAKKNAKKSTKKSGKKTVRKTKK